METILEPLFLLKALAELQHPWLQVEVWHSPRGVPWFKLTAFHSCDFIRAEDLSTPEEWHESIEIFLRWAVKHWKRGKPINSYPPKGTKKIPGSISKERLLSVLSCMNEEQASRLKKVLEVAVD